MPAHMTWPVIILYPPTLFGWVVGIVVLPIRYSQHRAAGILGVLVVVAAIGVLLFVLFTPGGGRAGSAELPWR
jgi:hypothetical protein